MILRGLTNRYNFQPSGPCTIRSKHQEGNGRGWGDARALPRAVCYAQRFGSTEGRMGGWAYEAADP